MSQYLEVAIARMRKSSPSRRPVDGGLGDAVGVRSDSTWNNPEPGGAVADTHGKAVGATLGNDVNLRDFEGRSALLLGKAKDNNASCSLGPLVRLFDDGFTMDDVRSSEVKLTITGTDGYVLEGASSMDQISRDPEDLLGQALSEHHYPDGLVLFLVRCSRRPRTVTSRAGFTHKVGDTVVIYESAPRHAGQSVMTSADAPAWTFGWAT